MGEAAGDRYSTEQMAYLDSEKRATELVGGKENVMATERVSAAACFAVLFVLPAAAAEVGRCRA
jgi:hypothetical protein